LKLEKRLTGNAKAMSFSHEVIADSGFPIIFSNEVLHKEALNLFSK
jgi:hypothetical protein